MKRFQSISPDSLCNISSALAFICALVTYWATADSGVSYWDCPEYVVTASRLEVGHPPGNPVWTLAMRFITIPFPARLHAWVINLASGLFMALAVFFLARIIFSATSWCLSGRTGKLLRCSESSKKLILFSSATGGALCFAFCDSAWFSAVEAEVYAMSAFMTSLSIWLMILRERSDDPGKRFRLLLLIAYIMGLSLGVHQLNLLCIPVLALIWAYGPTSDGKSSARALAAIILSFAIVALVLSGLMQGSLEWLEIFELYAANTLGLPIFSGAIAFCIVLTLGFILTIILLDANSPGAIITAFIFLWLSGIFCVGGRILIGGAISLAAACALILIPRAKIAVALPAVWSVALLLLGYSSFALILIRAAAFPPMNEAAPADVFALHRYISRTQYGSKPLLYGATPYSRPLMVEETDPDGTPRYRKFVLEKRDPVYVPATMNPRLNHRSGFLSRDDSMKNEAAAKTGEGYIKADYLFSRVLTPELDMWFPRITSAAPGNLESYENWAGMTRDNMTRLMVSETIGPDGKPDGKIGADGVRAKKEDRRPTYLQNLRMFLTYQAGYMYFRYLLWNFMGRQNDINSTGEIDHGNFITGFPPADDLMLGPQDLLPPEAGAANPGYNVYFGIPFLLGIIGIVWLARGGRHGRRTLAVITLFFLMTGLAIVVYLNQDPGEPRERDYSFLGSFMAFSIWIAFGFTAAGALATGIRNKTARTVITLLLPILTTTLLWSRNLDDHDRSGRDETSRFASNMLSSVPDALIFTKGDNYTFPLWYAQEVGGEGLTHTIIDISYLSTPEYAVNLMRLGRRGAPFVATPADVAFGAYAFTRIAPDADATPVPLSEALRELYSQRQGYPQFRHSRVFLAREGCDTVFINLRDLAQGGNIPFRKLMLLDIAAANHSLSNPRALCFLSSTDRDFSRVFAPYTYPAGFGDVFAPWIDSSLREATDDALLMSMAGKERLASVRALYLDPVILDQCRRQRGAIIRIARKRLDRGDITGAADAIGRIDSIFPYSKISAGSFTVADSTFAEGLEYAKLLLEIGESTGDGNAMGKARTLLEDMKARSQGWLRYRQSLPAWRREAISNDSRRHISWLPAIDSLLRKQIGEEDLTTP